MCAALCPEYNSAAMDGASAGATPLGAHSPFKRLAHRSYAIALVLALAGQLARAWVTVYHLR
jgi:hypothetical protein